MKLNIYEKKQVVKTYTADEYDLMFGTIEDVAEAVKLDEMKTGDDMEILKLVGNLVSGSKETVKDLLQDIFEGLSDEEIKHTKVKEIARVFVDVVRITIESLAKGMNEKN